MAFGQEKEIHPEQNKVLRLFKRFYKVTTDYQGNHFFYHKRRCKICYSLICLSVGN